MRRNRLGTATISFRIALALAALTGALLGPRPAGALTPTRLLGSGDPAPGFPDNSRIFDVRNLATRVADDGTIALWANVAGGVTLVPYGQVLYRLDRASRSSRSSDWERVALASRLQFGGNAFASFGSLGINAAGEVLLLARRPDLPSPCAAGEGPSPREVAVVYSRDGGHRIVAESFSSVPGLEAEWVDAFDCRFDLRDNCPRVPLVTTSAPVLPSRPEPLVPRPAPPLHVLAASQPLLADGGGVVLSGAVAADACTDAPTLAVVAPGATDAEGLLALTGDLAPGTTDGVRFGSTFRWSPRSLNASGQLAVVAGLDDGSEALYRWDPRTGLTLLARTGEPAAIAGGVTFAALGEAAIAEDGTPIFFAADADAPSGSIGFAGEAPPFDTLWGPDGEGGVRPLASVGTAAPGAPDGSVFAPYETALLTVPSPLAPVVNDAGEVAIVLPVDIPNLGVARGVFGPDASGGLSLRMLALGAAPGIPGFSVAHPVVVGIDNDRRILIQARIWPSGFPGETETDANGIVPIPPGELESALYLLEPHGSKRLLLRGSDPLEIRADDPQPIGSNGLILVSTNADLSRLALHVFQDGIGSDSAVFLLEVPEPRALAAHCAALATLAALARRRSSGDVGSVVSLRRRRVWRVDHGLSA